MALYYIVYFLAISAGLFVLIQKRRFSAPFLWLGVYMLTAGIFQITARILRILFDTNVLFYKATVPLTLFFIFLIFYFLFKSKRLRRGLFVFFAITESIIVFRMAQSFFSVLSVADLLVIYNVGVISFCLLYFFDMLRSPSNLSPFRQGAFWVVSGFFFYFLSSFAHWMVGLLFIFTSTYLATLNVLLVILFYLILWVGIFVHLREKRNYGIAGK